MSLPASHPTSSYFSPPSDNPAWLPLPARSRVGLALRFVLQPAYLPFVWAWGLLRLWWAESDAKWRDAETARVLGPRRLARFWRRDALRQERAIAARLDRGGRAGRVQNAPGVWLRLDVSQYSTIGAAAAVRMAAERGWQLSDPHLQPQFGLWFRYAAPDVPPVPDGHGAWSARGPRSRWVVGLVGTGQAVGLVAYGLLLVVLLPYGAVLFLLEIVRGVSRRKRLRPAAWRTMWGGRGRRLTSHDTAWVRSELAGVLESGDSVGPERGAGSGTGRRPPVQYLSLDDSYYRQLGAAEALDLAYRRGWRLVPGLEREAPGWLYLERARSDAPG
ncbi:hypothetical protein [Allostreptomyces psammosilenae]|uniref:Uncharacterized protein n=1 Tax=Allostreptomyces psammosilenae TaxID=1892865 RepID=A0A853A7K2_9ACTN|nr:hypothetical protein [Allostreptomyces psammosilenae]NYI06518.1 hypothetical protein [Allostreptomyces psammosilenae]